MSSTTKTSFHVFLMLVLGAAAAQFGLAQDCLKSLSEAFGYEGGVREAPVTNFECAKAESQADWITVAVTPPGTIAGSFRYFVTPNLRPAERKGTVKIAGQTLTITQGRTPASGIAGSPSPLQFRVSAKDPEKQKQSQLLKVWAGEDFQFSAAVAEADQKWLKVDAAKNAGGLSEFPVNIDATGLKPAAYTAHIAVNAPGAANSPHRFTVTLTVEP